jgi:hypothetical protein
MTIPVWSPHSVIKRSYMIKICGNNSTSVLWFFCMNVLLNLKQCELISDSSLHEIHSSLPFLFIHNSMLICRDLSFYLSYNITTNEHTPLKIHKVRLPLLHYHKLQIHHFLILAVISCTVAVEQVVKYSSCLGVFVQWPIFVLYFCLFACLFACLF